jgi:hypothetical protein
MNKVTHQEFVEWVCRNRGEYTVVGTYVAYADVVAIQHNNCGNVWFPKARNFKNGNSCPYCCWGKQLTDVIFKKWVAENRPEYESCEKYAGGHNPIMMRHLVCERQWKITPANFRYGKGCCYCFGTPLITCEKFVEWISLNRPEYECVGAYKNIKTKVAIRHKKCGNIWEITPNNFKRDRSCPTCAKKISKSEKALFIAIKEYYPDAIDNHRGILRTKAFELDIFVPSLNRAIEFNGEYWHLRNQKRIDADARKKKQCEQQNIDLLVVWFNEWAENKQMVIDKCLTFLRNS